MKNSQALKNETPQQKEVRIQKILDATDLDSLYSVLSSYFTLLTPEKYVKSLPDSPTLSCSENGIGLENYSEASIVHPISETLGKTIALWNRWYDFIHQDFELDEINALGWEMNFESELATHKKIGDRFPDWIRKECKLCSILFRNKNLLNAMRAEQEAIKLIEEAIKNNADTLEFKWLRYLEKIPCQIQQIPHLKHIFFTFCDSLTDVSNIYGLTELETIVFDDTGFEDEELLQKLPNFKKLRTLHLGSFNFELYTDHLLQLEHLEDFRTHSDDGEPTFYLDLKHDLIDKESVQEDITYKFPQKFSQLKNLKTFHLTYCNFDVNDVISVLATLPCLREFHIASAYEFPHQLSKLTQLEKLDFSEWESLEKLPDDIGKLQNLKSLDLSYDLDYMVLDELPDSFYTLKKLEKLKLYGCRNVTHFKDSFQDLKNLKTLYTVGSGIYSIPFSDEQLANLTEIGIQGEIPDLTLCSNLTKFYYYKSQVGWNIVRGEYGRDEEFSFQGTNIEKLSNLEQLRIMGGKLVDTTFLSKLTKLKKIDLLCDIVELPKDIDKLKCLERIEIRYAESLTCLPERFGNLPSLRSLSIEQGQLTDIPSSFAKLQSLKRLELRKVTGLKCIPKELYELIELEELIIADCCDLIEMADGISKLKNLKVLRLHSNAALEKLPNDLTKLDYLCVERVGNEICAQHYSL